MCKEMLVISFFLMLSGSAYAAQVQPQQLKEAATNESNQGIKVARPEIPPLRISTIGEGKEAKAPAAVGLNALNAPLSGTEDGKDAQVSMRRIFDDVVKGIEMGEQPFVALSLMRTLADRDYLPAIRYLYKYHASRNEVDDYFSALEHLCRYYAARNETKMAVDYAIKMRSEAEKNVIKAKYKIEPPAVLHALHYLVVDFLDVPEILYARLKAGCLLCKCYSYCNERNHVVAYGDNVCYLASKLLGTSFCTSECRGKVLAWLQWLAYDFHHEQANKLCAVYCAKTVKASTGSGGHVSGDKKS